MRQFGSVLADAFSRCGPAAQQLGSVDAAADKARVFFALDIIMLAGNDSLNVELRNIYYLRWIQKFNSKGFKRESTLNRNG